MQVLFGVKRLLVLFSSVVLLRLIGDPIVVILEPLLLGSFSQLLSVLLPLQRFYLSVELVSHFLLENLLLMFKLLHLSVMHLPFDLALFVLDPSILQLGESVLLDLVVQLASDVGVLGTEVGVVVPKL